MFPDSPDIFGWNKPKKKTKRKTTKKKTKKKSSRRKAIPAGMKIEAIKKAGGHCERCMMSLRGLKEEVHHRDHNRNNNTLDNLIVLCPNCHKREHYNSDGTKKKKPKDRDDGGLFGGGGFGFI